MSFFSRLFGRSKPQESTEETPRTQENGKPNGKVPPAKPSPISDERVKQIEARARQDVPATKPIVEKPKPQAPPPPVLAATAAAPMAAAQVRPQEPPPPRAAPPPAPTPSGDASQPAAKRPTSGLFKKQKRSNSTGGKLEAIPSAGLGAGPPVQPAIAIPVSVSPTPTPAATESGKDGHDAGVLEALLGNLDKSFDAILADRSESSSPGFDAEPNTDDFDRLSVLELFFDIATNHLRPVRNFMIELHLGDVRKEWVQIAQPAVKSIQSAAEQIDIPDLKRALDDFDALLSLATESPGDTIAGELREEMINHYRLLQSIMPQAFTLQEERDQRESLIIHSLLMQVPDVRKVTIDRLYRAGLSALEVLFLATTDDLAATTGIRKILAQRIVDKFQLFRRESRDSVPDAEQSAQRNKLQELIAALQDQQANYDRATAKRSIEEKRAHRLARQGILLEITVVLAQLGEVELVEQLERLPFEKRIDRLKTYLEELETKKG